MSPSESTSQQLTFLWHINNSHLPFCGLLTTVEVSTTHISASFLWTPYKSRSFYNTSVTYGLITTLEVSDHGLLRLCRQELLLLPIPFLCWHLAVVSMVSVFQHGYPWWMVPRMHCWNKTTKYYGISITTSDWLC